MPRACLRQGRSIVLFAWNDSGHRQWGKVPQIAYLKQNYFGNSFSCKAQSLALNSFQ